MNSTSDISSQHSKEKIYPWRCEWLGWVFAATFLIVGVPLYLRMPPWCDLTLYDVAARNILDGGVHYRDVFDTNLPGFVWLLAGIRAVFGWSTEAVRVVDLLVVAAVVWVLVKLARRAGANSAAIAWMVAGAAFFYPFTSEFNHAQRDVWMLLPAAVATWLRVRRIDRGVAWWPAVVEGAIWGVAVWIKPHVIFPAAAVWLVSAKRLAGSWRAARLDLLGNLVGGLAVGLAGVGWLIATGTWIDFVKVFQKWNGWYTQHMFEVLPHRLSVQLMYFPPLNLFLPIGVVLAVRDLWKSPVDDAAYSRRVLAALFLAWVFQAMLIQRQFHYVHVPEIFLLLAVAAAHSWALVPLAIVYAVLAGAVWLIADRHRPLEVWLRDTIPSFNGELFVVPRHPLFMPARMARWPDCFRINLPDRDYRLRMSDVALNAGTFASVDPVELGEIAAELRRLGAQDGEVLCWHDTPHALYLELGHRPPFRFMHLNTTYIATETYEMMKRELIKTLRDSQPPIRYIVSDLLRVYAYAPVRIRTKLGESGSDLLPPNLTDLHRETFPLDRPAIFRSGNGHGRYLIHVYDPARPFGPFDHCYIAPWPAE